MKIKVFYSKIGHYVFIEKNFYQNFLISIKNPL
jgi:hypothetical protein